MPRWPASGSVVLLRPRKCPRAAHLLCAARRPCDLLFYSSPQSSRDGRRALEEPQFTNKAEASGSSSPDTTASDTKRFLDSLQNQRVELDRFKNRLKERANSFSAAATLTLAELGGRLNKATGYEHIEALKRKVAETEVSIATKRQASRDAKSEYDAAVARRSLSQREVNDLLQRKSSWTDADVVRFTALVREDHLFEQEEARAKNQVALAEAEVEAVFNELMRTILNRYHEEQVWSDKIRSASTYGSLLVLCVNIIVFFLAIVVVEPWKRRRLAETFERRIEELSLENRALMKNGMSSFVERFDRQEHIFTEFMGALREKDSGESVAKPPPLPSVSKAAKAARDRKLWVAGATGIVGGSLLTLLIGLMR